MVRRWALPARVVPALLALSVVAAGCGVGTGTLRIDEAEAEVVAVVASIVEEAGLAPESPVAAEPLEQCELRTGGAGLRTRVTVRAALPDGPDELAEAIDAAASVLVARELIIVESGVPGTLLGQRDGMTVTVGSDGRVLEVDALTGCRPR